MAAEVVVQVAAEVCASRTPAFRDSASGLGYWRDEIRALTKTEQESLRVVACSDSRYIASPPLCCRRTHFFGTISGSRPICFLGPWGFSCGNAAWAARSLLFLHLQYWVHSETC